jgi:hypothetical protein
LVNFSILASTFTKISFFHFRHEPLPPINMIGCALPLHHLREWLVNQRLFDYLEIQFKY